MSPDPFKSSPKPEISIRAADNILRKKIGASIAMCDIFTPEKIQQCQKIVDQTMAGFLREMEAQLALLGEEYMKAADNPAYQVSALKKGNDLAFIIKKRMETLNFIFGLKVAKSLYDYTHAMTAYNPDVLLVTCKHVAVLNIILQDRITGDGGAMGEEMLANLRTLIKKNQK